MLCGVYVVAGSVGVVGSVSGGEGEGEEGPQPVFFFVVAFLVISCPVHCGTVSLFVRALCTPASVLKPLERDSERERSNMRMGMTACFLPSNPSLCSPDKTFLY